MRQRALVAIILGGLLAGCAGPLTLNRYNPETGHIEPVVYTNMFEGKSERPLPGDWRATLTGTLSHWKNPVSAFLVTPVGGISTSDSYSRLALQLILVNPTQESVTFTLDRFSIQDDVFIAYPGQPLAKRPVHTVTLGFGESQVVEIKDVPISAEATECVLQFRCRSAIGGDMIVAIKAKRRPKHATAAAAASR